MGKASDEKCCVNKCKAQAVAFWPVVDPDIPANPYCRKHLDEAKMRLLMKIQLLDPSLKKLNHGK